MRQLFIWGVLLALAGTANAQTATDEFGIERFRIGIDRAALLDVDWAGVPGHGSWSASAYVGVAHDPLVVYRDDIAIDTLIERRIATGLVGSIALWNRLQLGVGVDLIANQTGSESLMSLPSGGLGDARLIAKLLVYKADRMQVALLPTLTVPGGSAGGYLRESGPVFAPAIAASAAGARLRLAGNVGYRMRERVATAGLLINDEVFARAAAGVAVGRVSELALSFSLAAPPTARDGNRIAVETMVGGTIHVHPSLDVFLAGGAGLDNGFGTPEWRAVAGVRFASVHNAVPPMPPVPVPIVKVVEPAKPIAPPPPAEGTVTGRVLDGEGLPIGNAQLRIVHAGPPIAIASDPDGNFEATVQVGTVVVTAEVAEYQPGTGSAEVTAKATATIEIKLARKVRQGQLRGQVLSFGGKPLEATVIVNAAGKEVRRATADSDGNFTIELPAGSFEVVIEAAGHVTQRRTVKLKLDGVTVLNLDMRGAK